MDTTSRTFTLPSTAPKYLFGIVGEKFVSEFEVQITNLPNWARAAGMIQIQDLNPSSFARLFSEYATSITAEVDKTLAGLKLLNVKVHKLRQVRDYLIQDYPLTNNLAKICNAITHKFHQRADLTIELYIDPEIEDQYLTLYVRQFEYDSDIMNKIKEIRAQYTDLLEGKIGFLHITTDFQPPR